MAKGMDPEDSLSEMGWSGSVSLTLGTLGINH